MALEAPEGPVEPSDAMQGALQAAFNKIGENMSYHRGAKIVAPRVGTYVHHNGRVGVLVGVEGEISDETLADLCMHIAFSDPMGITRDDIPAELAEKEKEIAKQQAIESGKPENIAEKIVAGKVNKFLSANALLEQPFVRDDKKKVKNILGGAKVLKFARFAVGSPAS
jgi:elongation factor Ts